MFSSPVPADCSLFVRTILHRKTDMDLYNDSHWCDVCPLKDNICIIDTLSNTRKLNYCKDAVWCWDYCDKRVGAKCPNRLTEETDDGRI
jgi:hypothetical protein